MKHTKKLKELHQEFIENEFSGYASDSKPKECNHLFVANSQRGIYCSVCGYVPTENPKEKCPFHKNCEIEIGKTTVCLPTKELPEKTKVFEKDYHTGEQIAELEKTLNGVIDYLSEDKECNWQGNYCETHEKDCTPKQELDIASCDYCGLTHTHIKGSTPSDSKEEWEIEGEDLIKRLNIIDIEILNSIVYHKGLELRSEILDEVIEKIRSEQKVWEKSHPETARVGWSKAIEICEALK